LEDKDEWRNKTMKIEEFRTKARVTLSCASLGTTEEEMNVLAAFEQPLRKEYNFSVRENGTFRMYSPAIGSGMVFKMGLTSEHQQGYLEVLHEKLSAYRSIVERNRQANRHYHPPQLEADQAREMAAEALKESFDRIKESYKNRYAIRNTEANTDLEAVVKTEEQVWEYTKL
ncbi:MAG: hypothetical protein AABY26_01400, partial [Nanoarchaeota archaeon]